MAFAVGNRLFNGLLRERGGILSGCHLVVFLFVCWEIPSTGDRPPRISRGDNGANQLAVSVAMTAAQIVLDLVDAILIKLRMTFLSDAIAA